MGNCFNICHSKKIPRLLLFLLSPPGPPPPLRGLSSNLPPYLSDLPPPVMKEIIDVSIIQIIPWYCSGLLA